MYSENLTPLPDAVREVTLDGVARRLGCTAGAVWQAVQQKRQILIDQENWKAIEIRPFPSKKNAHKKPQESLEK